jgi:hypothetical protein
MALREIDENGDAYEVSGLSYQADFDRVWLSMTAGERNAIETEIHRRLNELIASPSPSWGSITNTSIEGGKSSPTTGLRGDWTDTAFEPIFRACGSSEQQAGMFLGNVWKMVIIGRPERWVGIRSDPTFPRRGITLQGKTYFLERGH